jgi:hypothetical protein
VSAELEGEKMAIRNQVRGSEDSGAFGGPGGGSGLSGPRTPMTPPAPRTRPLPQVRLPWTIPPLLDEHLWPSTKGDLSTERDAQRRRRSVMPESPALPELPPPVMEPAGEDDFPSRDDQETPVLPIGRADPLEVEMAEKASQQAAVQAGQQQQQQPFAQTLAAGDPTDAQLSAGARQALQAPADAPFASGASFFEQAAMGNGSQGPGADNGNVILSMGAGGAGGGVEVAMLQNLMSQFGGGGGMPAATGMGASAMGAGGMCSGGAMNMAGGGLPGLGGGLGGIGLRRISRLVPRPIAELLLMLSAENC